MHASPCTPPLVARVVHSPSLRPSPCMHLLWVPPCTPPVAHSSRTSPCTDLSLHASSCTHLLIRSSLLTPPCTPPTAHLSMHASNCMPLRAHLSVHTSPCTHLLHTSPCTPILARSSTAAVPSAAPHCRLCSALLCSCPQPRFALSLHLIPVGNTPGTTNPPSPAPKSVSHHPNTNPVVMGCSGNRASSRFS